MSKPNRFNWKLAVKIVAAAFIICVIAAVALSVVPSAVTNLTRYNDCTNHPPLKGWKINNVTVQLTKSVDAFGYDVHPNVYGKIAVKFVTEKGSITAYTADWSWTSDWGGAYSFKLWNQHGAATSWSADGPPNIPYVVKQVQVNLISGDYNETITFPAAYYPLGERGTLYTHQPSQIFNGATDHFGVTLGIVGDNSC
jgi:hypothetical protein